MDIVISRFCNLNTSSFLNFLYFCGVKIIPILGEAHNHIAHLQSDKQQYERSI